MGYEISDDEMNRLHACKQQLVLLLDLAGLLPVGGTVAVEGLLGFATMQFDALNSTLKTVEERGAAQAQLRRAGHHLERVDWLHALRIAAGRTEETPRGAGERIGETLAALAQVDAAWHDVAKVWADVSRPAVRPAQAAPSKAAKAIRHPETRVARERTAMQHERVPAGA